MTRRTPALIASLALAATLGLAGCGAKTTAREPDAQQARAVRVVKVGQQVLSGSLTASGSLVPREEAAVLAEVTGYRVARVLVDVGSQVRQGQTLVQLDGSLLQSQIDQQAAVAAQAAVQAEQAEDQAARVQGLDGQGVLSQEQINQRRFQARAARATANAQAAGLKDLKTRAGKLAVAAPVSGLILERTVRPGDLSAGGATPWFRIARDGLIELQAELSEADLSRVRPGQSAQVTLPSGGQVQGTVRLVSPQIDAQTKLGVVRVLLPVRSDVRAGGFGRAIFADVSGTALAVPETAVRYDADGASVMSVGADNKVKRVPVQTGRRAGGFVELIKGPPAGTTVVAAAAAFLLDGDRIRPVDGPAPAVAKPEGVAK